MVAVAGFPLPTAAEENQVPDIKDQRGILTVALENDLFSGKDSNYTNGFRLSYLSPEKDVPNWLENTANMLPFFAEEGNKRWGLSFGQSLFTPDDITVRAPQPDDQPYAAWLYGGVSLISDTGSTLDTFAIDVGMVGPFSRGGQVQDFFHDLVGTRDPQGWDYQLKDEPGIILTYERKWRELYEFSPFGWGADITPSAGASIGNIYTHATVGAVARFGYDLPADYGPPLIRPSLSGSDFFSPSGDFGWYLFAGVEGRAVARNIFLDGNTFKDSASVDKHPFVGGIQGGIAFTYDDVRLAYTHILRTDQFEGQKAPEEFGAITMSYRF